MPSVPPVPVPKRSVRGLTQPVVSPCVRCECGFEKYQQDEKAQVKNKEKARKVLTSRLLDMELRKQQDAIAKDRRSQVGTGERSEKIRTYHFKENRVTDHRVNFNLYRLTDVLNGDLEEVLDQVFTHYQSEKLKDATAVS